MDVTDCVLKSGHMDYYENRPKYSIPTINKCFQTSLSWQELDCIIQGNQTFVSAFDVM